MASVFKRDGFYVVKWKDASGRWRQKRTHCVTKDEAKRFVHDLEHMAERQRRSRPAAYEQPNDIR